VQQLTQQAQCTEPATRAAQLSAQLEREATALKAVSGERDEAVVAQQTFATQLQQARAAERAMAAQLQTARAERDEATAAEQALVRKVAMLQQAAQLGRGAAAGQWVGAHADAAWAMATPHVLAAAAAMKEAFSGEHAQHLLARLQSVTVNVTINFHQQLKQLQPHMATATAATARAAEAAATTMAAAAVATKEALTGEDAHELLQRASAAAHTTVRVAQVYAAAAAQSPPVVAAAAAWKAAVQDVVSSVAVPALVQLGAPPQVTGDTELMTVAVHVLGLATPALLLLLRVCARRRHRLLASTPHQPPVAHRHKKPQHKKPPHQ
jgi:hypothetical protein